MIEATQEQWNDNLKYRSNSGVLSRNIEQIESVLKITNVIFPTHFRLDYTENRSITSYEFNDCTFPKLITAGVEGPQNFDPIILNFNRCSIGRFEAIGKGLRLTINIRDSVSLLEVVMVTDFKEISVINDQLNKAAIRKFSIIGNKIDKGNNRSIVNLYKCKIDNINNHSFQNAEFRMECVSGNMFQLFECSLGSVVMTRCDFEEMSLTSFHGQLLISVTTIGIVKVAGTEKNKSSEYKFHKFTCKRFLLTSERNASEISFNKCNLGGIYFGEIVCEEIIVKNSIIDVVILPIKLMKFNVLRISGDNREINSIDRLYLLNGNFSIGTSGKPTIVIDRLEVGSLIFDNFYNNGNIYISEVNSKKETDTNKSLKIPELIFDFYRDFSINLEFYMEAMKRDYSDLPNELADVIEHNNSMDGTLNDFFLRKTDENMLSLINSDLGKINFISSDFSKMKMICKASKITEIFLSGTEMPKVAIGDHKDKQVAYAQLKKVYDSRGDSVSSNDYQAKELEAHFDYLENKTKTGEERRDYFTLWLNKYSNKFNQSYTRTLKYGLPVMGLIYWAYCLSLGFRICIGADSYDWGIFKHLVSLFPEFIYPIHTAGFVPKEMGLTSTFLIAPSVEFLARAVNGYLFFQFIQAFRKFGKK